MRDHANVRALGFEDPEYVFVDTELKLKVPLTSVSVNEEPPGAKTTRSAMNAPLESMNTGCSRHTATKRPSSKGSGTLTLSASGTDVRDHMRIVPAIRERTEHGCCAEEDEQREQQRRVRP